MSLNLVNKVESFLKENKSKQFTAREIAVWIFENHPKECEKKKSRSTATKYPINTDIALIQQLIAEISSSRPRMQKNNQKIKTTEERPRKYYYSDATDFDDVINAEIKFKKESKKENKKVSENDLYKLTSEYLWSEFRIYSKRIDENRSKNNKGPKGNVWLHPDIVGMEDLSGSWGTEIKDCATVYGDYKTILYSYEVKIIINRSNLRETFFQAVSNSSWANFGYLVTSEIGGNGTLEELRMLSRLHGIGVIHLDKNEPSNSLIIIPATEKINIDWNNANRLAEQNSDFKDYINNVRQFYQTRDIKSSDWDIIDIID